MSGSESVEFEQFAQHFPEAIAALRALGRSAAEDMDKGLLELVKVRASQLNGCAFCLQLHVNWARQAGIAQGRLDQLAVWREAPGFTAQERAALAWAEALTDLTRHGELDAVREAARSAFGEQRLWRLTLAVAAVNAWNRIAGPLGFTPPPAQ
ncbi:MAG: carboxymuconolactone decarboxylase family protein [Steroidobacteraceae bacterium]